MPKMDMTETIVSPEKRAETEHVSGVRQHIRWDGDASGRRRRRKPVAVGGGGCEWPRRRGRPAGGEFNPLVYY